MIDVLESLRPVALEEVLAEADLQDRVDRKYLVRRDTAAALLEQLDGTHRALQVDGRRLSSYSTVYLDTLDLACHRAHLQGRRRRWKARTRRYLDSDLCRLELKTKGRRGRTTKVATAVHLEQHGRLDDAGRDFLADALRDAYGVPLPPLAPVLEIVYRRATLVGDGERLTLDLDLSVLEPGGRTVAVLVPDAVLVESKAGGAPGLADRLLREAGVRETSVSKYCSGTALTRPELPAAPWRPVLRRWFRACPDTAPALPATAPADPAAERVAA